MELLIAGIIGMVIVFVISLVTSVLAFVLWLISLPFQLLGLVFKGIGWLIFMPLILLAIGAVLVFGLMPLLPIVLAVWFVMWVLKPRPADRTA